MSAPGAWALAWVEATYDFDGELYPIPSDASDSSERYPGQPSRIGDERKCPYPGCDRAPSTIDHVHSHYKDECHNTAMDIFAQVLQANGVTECPWQTCDTEVEPGIDGASAFSNHLRRVHAKKNATCLIIDDRGQPCGEIIAGSVHEHYESVHGLVLDARCGTYCYECHRWTIGRKSSDSHAKSHVTAALAELSADSRLIGSSKGPQVCPFCLTDETRPPSQRLHRQEPTKHKMHICIHIANVTDRDIVTCPFPSCDPLDTFQAHKLVNHFKARHSLDLLLKGEKKCKEDLSNIRMDPDTLWLYEDGKLPWQLSR